MVTYKTRYITPEGKNMTISFGLGEYISVNVIIGFLTIKEWKIVLYVDAGLATSKLLRKLFDLTFQHVSSSFPTDIEFTKDDFVRPQRATTSGISPLCHIAASSIEPYPHDNNVAGVSVSVHASLTLVITKTE